MTKLKRQKLTPKDENRMNNVKSNPEGLTHPELLLFNLGLDSKTGRNEIYGINIFKVREVINKPEITQAPSMPDGVVGFVSIRQEIIPVLDLQKICGIDCNEEPNIMIVTEYNHHVHGFLVHHVESIYRLSWSEIKEPPPLLAQKTDGLVTAISVLSDGQLMMLLDVENIIIRINGEMDDASLYSVTKHQKASSKRVFLVDDSSAARKQIIKTLEKMGVPYLTSENGKTAWLALERIAEEANQKKQNISDQICLVLTDIEMPEMDGYELTKKIKADRRFEGIPVLMHSSLTSESNKSLGLSAGADRYIGKFEAKELANVISDFL